MTSFRSAQELTSSRTGGSAVLRLLYPSGKKRKRGAHQCGQLLHVDSTFFYSLVRKGLTSCHCGAVCCYAGPKKKGLTQGMPLTNSTNLLLGFVCNAMMEPGMWQMIQRSKIQASWCRASYYSTLADARRAPYKLFQCKTFRLEEFLMHLTV